MSTRSGQLDDHKRGVRERWNNYVRAGFDPWSIPTHTPRTEDRMVAAMEYAAFQLGEINEKLARLMDLTEDARSNRR